MIRTSYFAKYRGDSGVSIAIKHPPGFRGVTYPPLFPRWSFLSKYLKDHDEAAYTESYRTEVLSKLDPREVLRDLDGRTILCWESSKKFCHRHLVAQWLKDNLGTNVEEE